MRKLAESHVGIVRQNHKFLEQQTDLLGDIWTQVQNDINREHDFLIFQIYTTRILIC